MVQEVDYKFVGQGTRLIYSRVFPNFKSWHFTQNFGDSQLLQNYLQQHQVCG